MRSPKKRRRPLSPVPLFLTVEDHETIAATRETIFLLPRQRAEMFRCNAAGVDKVKTGMLQ